MMYKDHPKYQNFPEPLKRNFYEKLRKDALFFHHELPRGRRDKTMKMMQWGFFAFFMVLSLPFIPLLIGRMNSNTATNSLFQLLPYLFFLLFFLYFLIADQHLGTLLINGKEHTWPKQGTAALRKGSIGQSIIGYLLFICLFIIAPWFFAIIFLIAAIVYLIKGVSWKKPPPVELKLSKEYYLLGEELEFSILSEQEQNFTFAYLINLKTVTIQSSRKSRKKHSDSMVSKVIYMDWQAIEKGVSTYRFSIPKETTIGTNFENPKTTGWLLLLEREQVNGHDSPYLIPIFGT